MLEWVAQQLWGKTIMQQLVEQKNAGFVDRRSSTDNGRQGPERRQFTNSHDGMAPEVAEMAEAIDTYKSSHRRKFITYQEIYDVIFELGYRKVAEEF